MKRASVILLTLCVLFVAGSASAQIPYMMIYYDDLYSVGNKECPPGTPGTIVDSCYVVAMQFNTWFNAVEYAISYPPQMIHLGEAPTSPLNIGSTPSGISQSWDIPLNGFAPALINKITFLWNCDGCTSTNIPVVVTNHPVSFNLRGVDWPNGNFFPIVGMTSLICGTTPEEETTWGQIKALYQQ